MVRDLYYLFDEGRENEIGVESLALWDDKKGLQKYGVQYREFKE
ncbi:hypothetical protein [Lactobacillus sp. PV012]|nr:hypothetical protein [Lactobacillus sp. PV012]